MPEFNWSLKKGDRVDPQERILRKVNINENNCWIWQGATNGTGTAKIKDLDSKQSVINASLYSWKAFKDKNIDLEYIKIIMTCNNKLCVNVEHMELYNKPKTDYIRFMTFIKINKDSGCWEWQGATKFYGYGSFRFEDKNWAAHRWIFTHKNGPIEDKLSVCHKCDNPKCCNIKHLFIGTHKENMKDMKEKKRGVAPKGENNGHSKFSDKRVIELREEYKLGKLNIAEIARREKVSKSSMNSILKGKTYKHLL